MHTQASDRTATLPVVSGLLVFLPLALLGNEVGQILRYPDVGSAVLFPPYAVLTAALVTSRRRHWIWYLLLGSVAHFVTHWPQWSLSWVLLADAANIARALTAALLLRWYFRTSSRIDSVQKLLWFVASAVVVAPAVGAAFGAASAMAHGAATPFVDTWIAWFVSNALTALTLMPVCLSLFDAVANRTTQWTSRVTAFEAVCFLLVLEVTSIGAPFAGLVTDRLWALPLVVSLPVLLWAALRFGPGTAGLALSAATYSAIITVDRSLAGRAPDEQILALQIFVLFTGASVLCLAALATAHRRAQTELRSKHRELEHLSRVAVLGQLSGTFAHELNQPLAAILSNAQAAQQLLRRTPPDLAEFDLILSDIAAADQRAAAVIQRMRALFTSGERRVQQIHSRELIEGVLQLARAELISHQITVNIAANPTLPAFPGDKVQLQQLLLNLVLNACETMNDVPVSRRKLLLTADAEVHGQVHIAVRDFGTGIDPGVRGRLFEAFVTTKPNGLGLGLSISNSIVNAHGGRLWAEDHSDGGTTLHSVFPIAGASLG